MIKFFRHIRQSIIMENSKTSRYLKYAIGEIILVVIGIMIALQINNWNENRKAQYKELILIKKIEQDLEVADSINKVGLQTLRKYQKLHKHIFEEIRGRASYDSSLFYHDLWWYSIYNPVISQNHSEDVSVLTNQSVREALNNYLKEELIILKAIENWDAIKINRIRPFIDRHNIKDSDVIFSAGNFWQDLMAAEFDMFNYKNLKEQYASSEFEQLLGSLFTMTSYLIVRLEEQQLTIQSFDNVLNHEIMKLTND